MSTDTHTYQALGRMVRPIWRGKGVAEAGLISYLIVQ